MKTLNRVSLPIAGLVTTCVWFVMLSSREEIYLLHIDETRTPNSAFYKQRDLEMLAETSCELDNPLSEISEVPISLLYH